MPQDFTVGKVTFLTQILQDNNPVKKHFLTVLVTKNDGKKGVKVKTYQQIISIVSVVVQKAARCNFTERNTATSMEKKISSELLRFFPRPEEAG